MLRERVTVTLEPELIEAIDLLVDKQTIRNRSHAFEHLLKEGIGLHQLTSAFLFFEGTFDQGQLEAVLRLCSTGGVRELFICLPAGDGRISEVQAVINSDSSFQVTAVPSDFGSGGALNLKREVLTQPFLLFWLDESLHLPASLIGPFTFHRQHNRLLTRLIQPTDESTFIASGVDIAQPELVSTIPAGVIHLRESIFPTLIQTGNVRGYAIS